MYVVANCFDFLRESAAIRPCRHELRSSQHVQVQYPCKAQLIWVPEPVGSTQRPRLPTSYHTPAKPAEAALPVLKSARGKVMRLCAGCEACARCEARRTGSARITSRRGLYEPSRQWT